MLILAGQSNAAGSGLNSDLSPPYDAPQPDVLYWDWEQWVPLGPGYGIGADPPGDRHGPELSLGRGVADRFSGEVRIVKGTAGGASLAVDWHPETGPLYPLLRQLVYSASLEVTPRGRPIELGGVCWMQGETDAKDASWAAAYADNLVALIAKLREDLRSPALPFVLGRISSGLPPRFPFVDTVRAAQESVAAADPNVACVDTDGLSHVGDQVHFDSAGLIQLGLDMAHALEHGASHAAGAGAGRGG